MKIPRPIRCAVPGHASVGELSKSRTMGIAKCGIPPDLSSPHCLPHPPLPPDPPCQSLRRKSAYAHAWYGYGADQRDIIPRGLQVKAAEKNRADKTGTKCDYEKAIWHTLLFRNKRPGERIFQMTSSRINGQKHQIKDDEEGIAARERDVGTERKRDTEKKRRRTGSAEEHSHAQDQLHAHELHRQISGRLALLEQRQRDRQDVIPLGMHRACWYDSHPNLNSGYLTTWNALG